MLRSGRTSSGCPGATGENPECTPARTPSHGVACACIPIPGRNTVLTLLVVPVVYSLLVGGLDGVTDPEASEGLDGGLIPLAERVR